jgi:hypothetical protein
MRSLPVTLLVTTLFATACARAPRAPAETTPPNTAARAIAVYRTVAESIYVNSTRRVVAVASTSLDSTCAAVTCADLAARWGVETLWWARGDSSEARDARADLLARAALPFDVRVVAMGQAMLLEADAGDVPSEGATVDEWIRFRAAHADAAGAMRMSPVGFSRSGRTAVTFVDWRCGPSCGHTIGVALTATSDTSWTIAEMLLVTSRNK